MILHEFDIIQNFFALQSLQREDVVLGIGDDAAIVKIPQDHQLVITTDTLVSDVHFPSNTTAYDIGFKSLAVNLSDLAAMGAIPAWFTLALTLPEATEIFLKDFCEGLFELAHRHQIQLVGGDTTRGAFAITIQALGFVPNSQALKRNGAKPGDLIYVSNTLGDAALGLMFLQNKINLNESDQAYCLNRLNLPEPRIDLGQTLRGIATSAIDISDGLAADLIHILNASGVGAHIDVDKIPLSDAMQSLSRVEAIEIALTGGDDYELCFTVPKNKEHELGTPFTCIGEITETKHLDLRYKDGTPYNGSIQGYQHF